MSPQQYIQDRLKTLVVLFPELRARYDDDSANNSHVIEIIPNEIFHKNKEYQRAEENIIFDFIELYPFQNIIFISGDDDYSIEKVDFEISGYNFNTVDATVCNNYFIQGLISTSILPQQSIDLLDDYTPVFTKEVTLMDGPGIQTAIASGVFYDNNNIPFWERLSQHLVNKKQLSDDSSGFKVPVDSGENTYALAA